MIPIHFDWEEKCDVMDKPDAAVFILMGQSNAVGCATLIPEQDRIVTPLSNVFGLTRTHNLSYDNQKLVWTGYTSHDTILGEELDHTCSVTNCLARFWQEAIDVGIDLPDLYIINISVGGQGVSSEFMWHPKRKPILVPGPASVVNISLCSFASHILSLIQNSFEAMGKTYEIIGLHWRGGESDFCVEETKVKSVLKNIYQELFQIFYDSLGQTPPLILHRIVCEDVVMNISPSGESLRILNFINDVFEELENENENISIFDMRKAPNYILDVAGNGIFVDDLIHYTAESNQWVARQVLENYCLNIKSYKSK